MTLVWLFLFCGNHEINLSTHDIYSRPKIAVSDKTICIVDSKERELVFIDKFTKQALRKGGRGNGPGEFQFIQDIKWSKETKLFYIFDYQKAAITTFTEEGQLSGSFTTPYPFQGFAVGPANSIFYSEGESGKKGSEPSVIHFNLKNSDKRTVLKLPPLEKDVGVHRSDPTLTVSMKFEWDPKLIIGGNLSKIGFAYSNTTKLYIWENKQKLREVEFRIKRFQFVDEDLDRRFSGPASQFRKKLEPYLEIPEAWPAVEKIFYDQGLFIIVSPSPQRVLGSHFAIISDQGELKKTGSFAYDPKAISDRVIFYTVENEDGDILILQEPIDKYLL